MFDLVILILMSAGAPDTRPAASQPVSTRPSAQVQISHEKHDRANIRRQDRRRGRHRPAATAPTSPQTRPSGPVTHSVEVGMTVEEANDAMDTPGVELSDDLAGTSIYRWTIELNPGGYSPDGRHGIRPLLSNATATVKDGRITSVHWD